MHWPEQPVNTKSITQIFPKGLAAERAPVGVDEREVGHLAPVGGRSGAAGSGRPVAAHPSAVRSTRSSMRFHGDAGEQRDARPSTWAPPEAARGGGGAGTGALGVASRDASVEAEHDGDHPSQHDLAHARVVRETFGGASGSRSTRP
jgi:hypothetical protein